MHGLDLRAPGPDHERWRRLCARSAGLEGHADAAAREVIAAVRDRGDAAVAELTLRFEGRSIDRFELGPGERRAACEALPADLRAALQLAADNIRRFHATQLPRDTGLHTDDARLVTRARPLQRVAVYATGGTAAYPSSVLMTDGRDADIADEQAAIDLSGWVVLSIAFYEEGLLGMAFHPKFKEDGQFFLFYTKKDAPPHTSVISRFRVSSADAGKADPATEEELLRVPQPYWNYNGGTLAFGPDDKLYIALGDGGAFNDPHGNGQNLGTLNGSILRIDVDGKDEGLAYAVPKDNPFVGEKGACPEIWAYGIRNIWRLSLDDKTGALWAADDGQDIWEEINLIERGAASPDGPRASSLGHAAISQRRKRPRVSRAVPGSSRGGEFAHRLQQHMARVLVGSGNGARQRRVVQLGEQAFGTARRAVGRGGNSRGIGAGAEHGQALQHLEPAGVGARAHGDGLECVLVEREHRLSVLFGEFHNDDRFGRPVGVLPRAIGI